MWQASVKWRTPQKDDERIVLRFAFLPEKMNNGITVWLEFYWSLETYYGEYLSPTCFVGWIPSKRSKNKRDLALNQMIDFI